MKYGKSIALAAMLAACSGGQSEEAGSALVKVSGMSTSLMGGDVTLIISDYKGGASQALVEASGVYSGMFEDISAGLHQFCANAGADFDQSCTYVTITKNKKASVNLVIQQKPGKAGTINTNSPFISAISLSDGAPYYGETITMVATATDPSAAHALKFKWSAECSDTSFESVLGDDTHETATLTTSCHGTETIRLQVTDEDQNISSVVSIPLIYSAQGAIVSVTMNAWPSITSITTPDAQLNPGDRTTLTVAANDAEDGTNLTYSWTASCGETGSIFSAPDMATTGFLAPNMTGDCTATVTVSDHGGGSTSGSIIIHVGAVSPTVPVFNSIPAGIPNSLVSQPFQAQQTAEFGDYISLAPDTGRHAVMATIYMVTWATEAYTHDITFNVYSVSGTSLTKVGSRTQAIAIPARPAGDPSCPLVTDSLHQFIASDGKCHNGYAFPVTFDLTGITLPDSFVYGIAYNTMTWGYSPTGVDGPYDSLNVGLIGDGNTVSSTTPSIGSDPNPGALLRNYNVGGVYTGFVTETGWTGYAPAVEFFAK